MYPLKKANEKDASSVETADEKLEISCVIIGDLTEKLKWFIYPLRLRSTYPAEAPNPMLLLHTADKIYPARRPTFYGVFFTETTDFVSFCVCLGKRRNFYSECESEGVSITAPSPSCSATPHP
jgi:hypothetical protein